MTVATATASATAGPRYAPEDPTLPKPWKGLVDGRTGYLYFWNPETNVTQYERPTPAPVSSASPAHLTSSVGGQKPSVLQHTQSNHNVDGGNQLYRGSTDERSYQSDRVGTAYTQGASDRAAASDRTAASVSFVSQGSSGAGDGLSADAYRRKHEITVIGGNVPPPYMSFDAATGFPPELLREVQHAGFSAPTPIQAQSWPIALQGKDIVAIAKTGSGKTLGYLIPGFIHLKKCRNDPQIGPTVLVLSPTRELATQIQDEAMKFGRSSRISCVCLYGGAPKGPQLRDLERGVDIVVATPGRLNDILEMKRLNLEQISYLVLDEADRMLDMGFEPQIRKILKEVPSRRQTLMFTATWPKEVRKIAAEFFVNPYQVNIGNVDELVANKSITQHVEVISSYEKQRRLEEILRSQEPGSKIIVFCATKRMCDMLAGKLDRNFGAAAIHGDKSQADRDFVLNQFRSGRCPILVATDVAARGLDVKDIRVVVNYDFPTGIEDYIHRIGRTGRAGATGVAYTFISDQDSKHASDLVKILEGANQNVPQKVREMAANSGGMRGPRRWGPSSGGGYDGGRGGGGGRYDSGGGYGGRGGGGRFDSGGGGYGGSRGGSGSDRYGGGGDSYGRYGGGRNRSPSPPSKGQGGGWGSRDRSRSPGPAAAAPAGMSFHQMMMEKYRS